jgi:uncharacterized protein YbjT (DUF2867 family)
MAHQTLRAGYAYTGSSWAEVIRHGGVIREPYADARYPLIHEDDLAAVAAALLADDTDRYAGQTVTAYGPPISPREQVALIGQALGRETRSRRSLRRRPPSGSARRGSPRS